MPYTETCSHCGGSLIQFLATGAEYLHEELRTVLPETPVVRITGEATKKKDLRQFQQSAGNPGTIVIGTQVLSKLYGLHVDRLILMGQDEFSWVAGYRAHEKAFQIFRNLIDALTPAHVVLCTGKRSLVTSAHLADERLFFDDELPRREVAGFPPYARLFLIEVSKRTKESGERVIAALIERLKELGLEGQMVGGPIFQKKESFRWRVLLKGDERELAEVLPYLHGLRGARVEPDPLNI
jgi:primosomal protein N' (replication factor Y)